MTVPLILRRDFIVKQIGFRYEVGHINGEGQFRHVIPHRQYWRWSRAEHERAVVQRAWDDALSEMQWHDWRDGMSKFLTLKEAGAVEVANAALNAARISFNATCQMYGAKFEDGSLIMKDKASMRGDLLFASMVSAALSAVASADYRKHGVETYVELIDGWLRREK